MVIIQNLPKFTGNTSIEVSVPDSDIGIYQ